MSDGGELAVSLAPEQTQLAHLDWSLASRDVMFERAQWSAMVLRPTSTISIKRGGSDCSIEHSCGLAKEEEAEEEDDEQQWKKKWSVSGELPVF